MADKKYDIFISYRNADGAQYARILQLELEKYHYKVFLDYDELTDGVFGKDIADAIRSATVFIMVLTPEYLTRTMEDDSWITKEIRLAIESKKHFIPVNPDRKFNGIPKDTPEDIAAVVNDNQHSSIDFGQALGATVDMMVKNRIVPHIRSKRIITAIIICLLCIAGGLVFFHQHAMMTKTKTLKAECEAIAKEKRIDEICHQYINWDPGINLKQLQAVSSILNNMEKVEGGTFMQGAAPNEDGMYSDLVCTELETPQLEQSVQSFFIGKYEVSAAEWCGIMGLKYDKKDALMPMTDITFNDCILFTNNLSNLTGLGFQIPTETEWEFAARGGNDSDGTIFSGDDNPDKVAWYNKNSAGKAHVRNDIKGGLYCNSLNLYDMSGNVSEWCSTYFHPYDTSVVVPNANTMVIRGGCFDSDPYELTVYHREPSAPETKNNTLGIRIIIKN